MAKFDPNTVGTLQFPTNSNSPFAFLENVLTPETLASLRREHMANLRAQEASMTANERTGFGVGNLFLGLFQRRKGSKQSQMTRQAVANANAIRQAQESTSQMKFDENDVNAPLKQNIALLDGMAQNFHDAGNTQDAMRAQIQANTLRAQLAKEIRTQQQADAQLRIAQLSGDKLESENTLAQYNDVYKKFAWPIHQNANGEWEHGEALDLSTPAGRKKAELLQQSNEIVASHDEMMTMFKTQMKAINKAVYSNTSYEEKRKQIEAANAAYRTGTSLLTTISKARFDPTSDTAKATSYIERIMHDAHAAGIVAKMMTSDAYSRPQPGDPTYLEHGHQIAQKAMDKLRLTALNPSITVSQVTNLAYGIAIAKNGPRPTNEDFENAVRILKGTSGDRAIAVRNIRQALNDSGEQTIDAVTDFIQGDPNSPQAKGLLPAFTRLQQFQKTFNSLADDVINRLPIPGEDTGYIEDPNTTKSGDYHFSLGGPQ